MSFNILYVEDYPKDYKRFEKAINEYNGAPGTSEKIELCWARNLKELGEKLSHRIDLVLTDMYLTPTEGDQGNRIRDVVAIIREWSEHNDVGRPKPIIAYTIDGTDAFKNRKGLYDIWDKNSTSIEYITWRLSELSKELTRIRPDALIQTLIRTELSVSNCVSWHADVLDMIKSYDKGWTEADQIERTGRAIENIAQKINAWEDVLSLWQVVKDWEFFGRAVSLTEKGYARHSINVFWIGYYLIHHNSLRNFFEAWWLDLKLERPNMQIVKDDLPLEAINNIWFYTGLFHDMAGCLEKFSAINRFRENLYSPFKDLGLNLKEISEFSTEYIRKQATEFLNDFTDPLRKQIKKAWEESLEEEKADHGILAAFILKQNVSNQKQNRIAQEAGRAIALHSLIRRFSPGKSGDLTWEKEPFACLLILCDQLQTWDRERGDTKLSVFDGPERAELAELTIDLKEIQIDGNTKEIPHIKIGIDYIAPSHLKHSPELYQRVKDDLDFILRDKPKRAINKIGGQWPFLLDVTFSLSKDPLNAFIKITPEEFK